MNDRNTEQQIRYLEEVCTCLHRAGFETQPLEDSQMPVYWNGVPLCRIPARAACSIGGRMCPHPRQRKPSSVPKTSRFGHWST